MYRSIKKYIPVYTVYFYKWGMSEEESVEIGIMMISHFGEIFIYYNKLPRPDMT